MLPLIMSMTLPPFCAMMMQYTYNFVDSMFVSWISEDALTAVSLAFPINTFILACCLWLGVGTNVLVAKRLGEKQQEAANRVSANGVMLSLVVGIALTIFLWFAIKPYFSAYTDDETTYTLCIDYMSICLFMVVPDIIHISIQKILQGTGNMIGPMWFMMVGVVFNFIFDPLLIFGVGPFPEMGIQGAALSTVGGYTVSMICGFLCLYNGKQRVRPTFKGFRFDPSICKNILSIGMPSFIMNVLGAFMVAFTNGILMAYSAVAVAFFGVYFKCQQIIERGVNSLVQGVLPIMSYNFGAKKLGRMKECFRWGILLAGLIMGFGSVVLLCIPGRILGIFHASEAMLAIGVPAMRIMATGYIFAGISIIIASYLQAAQNITQSNIVNLLRQSILLFPLILILSRVLGIYGVWIAFPISDLQSLYYG